MDDQEIARVADRNRTMIGFSGDPAFAIQSIIQDKVIVIGLYPDKEAMVGWDKYIIKGYGQPEHDNTLTTALWCRSIEEARALSRLYGDESSSK